MKKYLFVILAMVTCAVHAQVSVEASIDNIEMLVGQQAHVTLKAVAKENSKVEFPSFQPSQYVTPGIEVLNCQPQEDKIMVSWRSRWFTPSLLLTIPYTISLQ